MKVLILKPSSLGDVVQALPVLRRIKLHWPQSEIYWWIESTLAPLLEGDPDLAGVVPFDRRGWAAPRNWVKLVKTIAWMRCKAFDYVIDLQCLARSGAFAWLANGKFLVGLDEPREGARGYYDVAARRASFHTHAVDWYLSVLPVIGVPDLGPFDWLPPRPGARESLNQKWNPQGLPWVLLQPGARWDNKRWPTENFSELVRRLVRSTGPETRFAILGSANEAELGRIISAAAPGRTTDLTGKLTLPEMIECIRQGSVIVTNDTGPMHVAAAVKTPIVAIFGPTEPRRTGPYGQLQNTLQAKLPCVPCLSQHCKNPNRLECLKQVTVDDVHWRVTEALARSI